MGDIMFNNHLVINNDNEETLYLFIDFNYELGRDFSLKGKKEKIETLYDKVMNYIKEKKIDFKMGKVLLVVGGLVIGSLFIQNYQYSDVKGSLEPKYQYVEQIDIFSNDSAMEEISISPQTNVTTDIETSDGVTNPIAPETGKSSTSSVIKAPTKSASIATPPIVSETPAAPNTSLSQAPTTPVQEPAPVQEVAPAPVPSEKIVTLYRYNGTVEQISLEEYVVGVVSAEMPASFNIEALKAQSVLARTYALKKIDQNQVLKDDTSSQVYKDIGQLKVLWGSDFETYYNKVKNAVASTKSEYITYNGAYIEAVYHSTSNGQTEDSIAVWGNAYPYLKSVDSHWDLSASSYLRETEKEFNVLSSIIGLDFNSETNVEVISRTSGGRIDQIKIGDTLFTGIELRTLLGLRSADFDVRMEENSAFFVTRGYGHGVGMSQYGANGMAKEGYTYKDILSHYYTGTQIKA